MCVNRSWKIPQSDHFYINQENGFCQDFVDCNGFFGLRGRLQVNKSAAILIQSRQSCCNSVQSSIVKFLYNPVQSIQSKHNWGTHRGIVPKTGISWQTTWGSNPTTITKAKLTFQNGSMQGSDQPKILVFTFSQSAAIEKNLFRNRVRLWTNYVIATTASLNIDLQFHIGHNRENIFCNTVRLCENFGLNQRTWDYMDQVSRWLQLKATYWNPS